MRDDDQAADVEAGVPPATQNTAAPDTGASTLIEFPSKEFDAAVAQECRERDFVFVNVGAEIHGVPVVLMTLRQALDLIYIESPFLAGGRPTDVDVLRFLWFLSPDYDAKADKRPYPAWKALLYRLFAICPPAPYQRLCLQVASCPLVFWSIAIRDYIDLIFVESPGRRAAAPDSAEGGVEAGVSPAESVPLTSFASDYIDRFGAEYGWSKDETLDSPLAQLFGLMRSMEIRHSAAFGKRAPLINYRSDAIVSAHMERRNTPELKQKRLAEFANLFAHAATP